MKLNIVKAFQWDSCPLFLFAFSVYKVFENVAQKYDVMNDAMSLGIHRLWKDVLLHVMHPQPGVRLLDVAGGTGMIFLGVHLLHNWKPHLLWHFSFLLFVCFVLILPYRRHCLPFPGLCSFSARAAEATVGADHADTIVAGYFQQLLCRKRGWAPGIQGCGLWHQPGDAESGQAESRQLGHHCRYVFDRETASRVQSKTSDSCFFTQVGGFIENVQRCLGYPHSHTAVKAKKNLYFSGLL